MVYLKFGAVSVFSGLFLLYIVILMGFFVKSFLEILQWCYGVLVALQKIHA